MTTAVVIDLSTTALSACPEVPDERRQATELAGGDSRPGVHPGSRVGADGQLRGGAGELVRFETYWLPVLGPSGTWAPQRISAWLATAPPSGRWLPVEPLARLVDLRMAEIDEDRAVLAVRTVIPPLTDRQVARLPEHLAPHHDADPRRDLRRLA